MVSGNDCKVHVYVPDSPVSWTEQSDDGTFRGDSPVLSMEIEALPHLHILRFVLGRENGKCEIVELRTGGTEPGRQFFGTKDVVRRVEIALFSPISRAGIFAAQATRNIMASIPAVLLQVCVCE